MNFNQNAGKIYNVNGVENFHAYQLLILNEFSDQRSDRCSNDYYNLIVYGGEPWFDVEPKHITMPMDRAIAEDFYVGHEIKARYFRFTQEAISELETFPCVFAYENFKGKCTKPDHEAAVGQLTRIKKRSNGIEVYFRTWFHVNQQRINELSDDLGIIGLELSRTHWTVKEIDLMEVLQDNGMLRF